jgi:hypothetical protein
VKVSVVTASLQTGCFFLEGSLRLIYTLLSHAQHLKTKAHSARLNIISDDALDTSHVAHLFGTTDFVGDD